MALSAKNRAEIVDLIAREADFERSSISGRIVRDATACPRQGELTDAEYQALMGEIAANLVRHIVFSFITPIAWVGRDDRVTLVDRKFSSTTSQHQKMVREAFGGLVEPLSLQKARDEAEVQLSENEEIILRRMRDEDGTEYTVVMTGAYHMVKLQKTAPRDQVEPLIAKGLVKLDEFKSAVLTDKGRAHLDKIQPVVTKEVQVPQYSDLTEDELIDLAENKVQELEEGPNGFVTWDIAQELKAILGALKKRREATVPARIRIGEYLRQQQIAEKQYEQDINSGSDYARRHAKAPQDILDEIRSDEYARKAALRLGDLRMLVSPLVRDAKAEFYAEQQRRLERWMQGEGAKLPEKQRVLLSCIAQGHLTKYRSSSDYGGKRGCPTCARPDGRTLNALLRKEHIVSVRPGLGGAIHTSYTLMLKAPQ